MGDSTTDYDKGHSPGPGRNYLREYMDFHGPAPGRNYWREYGVGPLVPPKPSDPPDEPGVFDEFGSAFHHSLIQSNPEMYGAALEAAGVSSGSESMRQAGERLQRWAAGLEAGRPPITFEEAEGFGENLRALAGLGGSAFGSTVPPLAMGAAGAVGGAAVAGPPGALVGGFIGATVAGAPLNLGEAYQQFKQEGVEPERAAKFAIAIAVPITALDVGGLGGIVSRSLGAPIKKTVLTGHWPQDRGRVADRGVNRSAAIGDPRGDGGGVDRQPRCQPASLADVRRGAGRRHGGRDHRRGHNYG